MEWKHHALKKVAQNIVTLLNKVTGNDVQFMGKGGEIIATTQPHRIGTIHEGAKKVMNYQADFAAITAEDAKNMEGVLPGYTGPIEFNGKRIACIGITGDPEKVKHLQEMAALIVNNEIIKKQETLQKQKIFDLISEQIHQISNVTEQFTIQDYGPDDGFKSMENIVVNSYNDVIETKNIIELINNIAEQINQLNKNIAINTSRSEEHTEEYVGNIEEILKEIHILTAGITTSLFKINSISEQHSQALRNLTESMSNIQKTISNLNKKEDIPTWLLVRLIKHFFGSYLVILGIYLSYNNEE